MDAKRVKNNEIDPFSSSDSFDKLVASEEFDKIMAKNEIQNPSCTASPGSRKIVQNVEEQGVEIPQHLMRYLKKNKQKKTGNKLDQGTTGENFLKIF